MDLRVVELDLADLESPEHVLRELRDGGVVDVHQVDREVPGVLGEGGGQEGEVDEVALDTVNAIKRDFLSSKPSARL